MSNFGLKTRNLIQKLFFETTEINFSYVCNNFLIELSKDFFTYIFLKY